MLGRRLAAVGRCLSRAGFYFLEAFFLLLYWPMSPADRRLHRLDPSPSPKEVADVGNKNKNKNKGQNNAPQQQPSKPAAPPVGITAPKPPVMTPPAPTQPVSAPAVQAPMKPIAPPSPAPQQPIAKLPTPMADEPVAPKLPIINDPAEIDRQLKREEMLAQGKVAASDGDDIGKTVASMLAPMFQLVRADMESVMKCKTMKEHEVRSIIAKHHVVLDAIDRVMIQHIQLRQRAAAAVERPALVPPPRIHSVS